MVTISLVVPRAATGCTPISAKVRISARGFVLRDLKQFCVFAKTHPRRPYPSPPRYSCSSSRGSACVQLLLLPPLIAARALAASLEFRRIADSDKPECVCACLRSKDRVWLKTRLKGERFDFCCVRFGRFWPSGGIWRLIDPFCEGSVGELGAHGAGLSSYFKLIKWLFLTFSVLSVLYAVSQTVTVLYLNSSVKMTVTLHATRSHTLTRSPVTYSVPFPLGIYKIMQPIIVINTFPNDGWSTTSFRTATWESTLSATMLGNLASRVNASVAAAIGARVSKDAVAVPARFCFRGGGADGCTLRQER